MFDENSIAGEPAFGTLSAALEAAATGGNGFRFFDVRGEIVGDLRYAELVERAKALALRLGARFERGARIGVVAETSPDFITTFFACQYAGLMPAPMPLPVNLGGKEGYLQQIRLMALGSGASAVVGPENLKGFLEESIDGLPDIAAFSFDDLGKLSVGVTPPEAFRADEGCYIQYSSGSTSAPKGVIGTQNSVTANLHGITEQGLKLTDSDHAVSWLPLYHDMGLIGFALSPMFAGVGTDFIATSDFVRRPLLWLRLMTQSGATATYSPSFGYELAAKRAARVEPGTIDLSKIRVAGIGADMVRPEALKAFAEAFAPVGFNPNAFLPSYGMAEATLAITFTEMGAPVEVDYVDMRHFNRSGIAQPASALTSEEHRRGFVLCGSALPGHGIEVRDDNDQPADERVVGRVFIKGPSLTPGYFSDDAATEAMYDGEWLNTGDMGYRLNGQIVITGRAKDLIIINGRNIWPQDIEWAVEEERGVRRNGVAAFSVDNGVTERIVVVVERRGGMTAEDLTQLKRDIAKTVQSAAGAPAEIVLARPHSMVMTSSGKLSRAKVKQKYLTGAFAGPEIPPAQALAEASV